MEKKFLCMYFCYSYNEGQKIPNSLCSYELNVFDNASPSVTRSHGLRTRKTTTRTTTTANVSFGTFRRWCLGDGVVHHFSHTTRGRMVFAIPLADDHPDNALKDGYLSRSEPGTLSCDHGNRRKSFWIYVLCDTKKSGDIQIEYNSI